MNFAGRKDSQKGDRMKGLTDSERQKNTTRRDFLKASSTVVSAGALGALGLSSVVHAGGSDAIRVGMIG